MWAAGLGGRIWRSALTLPHASHRHVDSPLSFPGVAFGPWPMCVSLQDHFLQQIQPCWFCQVKCRLAPAFKLMEERTIGFLEDCRSLLPPPSRLHQQVLIAQLIVRYSYRVERADSVWSVSCLRAPHPADGLTRWLRQTKTALREALRRVKPN